MQKEVLSYKKKNIFLTTILNTIPVTLLFHSYCFAMEEDRAYFAGFHTRLKNKFSDPSWNWDDETTETYFTHIPPSQTHKIYPDEEGIRKITVLRDGQKISQNANDRSYNIDDLTLADLSQIPEREDNDAILPIRITRQGQPLSRLEWTNEEGKKSFCGNIKDYTTAINAIRQGCWYRTLVATTQLPPSPTSRSGSRLEIRVEYKQKHPLDVKGMAISYSKSQHNTRVFFDIADPLDQSDSRYLSPKKATTLNHQRNETNNDNVKWLGVSVRHIWHYPTIKMVYRIFPNEQAQINWDPDRRQFMKLTEAATYAHASLSEGYEDVIPNENARELKYEPVKIFSQMDLTRSQIDPTRYFLANHPRLNHQQIDSDYLYGDGEGKFFITKCYQEQWEDTRTHELITVRGIYKTPTEVKFQSDVTSSPPDDWSEDNNWPEGAYRVIEKTGNRRTWKREEPTDVEIETENENGLFTVTLYEGNVIDNFNNLQKFAISPSIDLSKNVFNKGTITAPICTELRNWTKITQLNLSNIQLERVSWDQLLNSVGGLIRLTSLNLSSNGFKSEHLGFLENCFGKLTSLTHLQLQGQNLIMNSPKDFNALCGILLRKGTRLVDLHIDNLPEEMHYPYKAALFPAYVVFDLMTSYYPKNFIAPAATSLISLPRLTSLTLYRRQGDILYNYKKQKTFKKRIKEMASQKGKPLNINKRPYNL
jgi:hypothetical protein